MQYRRCAISEESGGDGDAVRVCVRACVGGEGGGDLGLLYGINVGNDDGVGAQALCLLQNPTHQTRGARAPRTTGERDGLCCIGTG